MMQECQLAIEVPEKHQIKQRTLALPVE